MSNYQFLNTQGYKDGYASRYPRPPKGLVEQYTRDYAKGVEHRDAEKDEDMDTVTMAETLTEVQKETARCQGWVDASNGINYLKNPYGFQGGSLSVAWMVGFNEHDAAVKVG